MLLVPVSLDITPDTGELKRDASRKHSPKQKSPEQIRTFNFETRLN